MFSARVVLSIIALIFVSGGVVMQFLVILSGSSAGGPSKNVYFLQASTDGIPTLRNPTRWTFLALCGSNGGPENVNCGATGAAPPFSPPMNFATATQVPYQFTSTSRFFYLSKAMFGMWIVATFFAVFCIFTGIPGLFRLTGDFKSGFSAILACLFQGLAAALMTAWAVEGRDIFLGTERAANVGFLAFGLAWGSMACFLSAAVLYVLGGVVTAEGPGRERRERAERKAAARGVVTELPPQGKDYI